MAHRVTPLTIYVVGYLCVWIAFVVVMLARRPSPEEAVKVWGWAVLFLTFGAHISAVWLIWGVMPFVSRALQFMYVAILITNSPSQIICNPQNTIANRIGVVIVQGSTALFLATRDDPYSRWMALYVIGFGAMMLVLSDRVGETVRHTVAARLASDDAAATSERLLGIVAAERDAKTRFIAAASHDLAQPLQAAALFFDQTLRAGDADARAKAAEGVRRAFASADALLSHMLNHLRLEADAVEPHLSRVSLAPMLNKLAMQYQPAARAAGMTIKLAAGDAVAMLDPVLAERALGNLIQNAIVHSGGTRILLAVRRDGADALRLWVLDNGVGVARADQPLIFDDYFQAAALNGPSRSGFGLGLSSVRRIAHVLGGEAGIDPRWMNGAAFYLRILDASAIAHRPPAVAARRGRLPGKRVAPA